MFDECLFWYNIMVNCANSATLCGIAASFLSLFCAVLPWMDGEDFNKKYLFIPVVIVILGFCYYTGMERLIFEVNRNLMEK